MPRRLAELCREERLDEVPRNGGSFGSAAKAEDVHVIVFDPLLGREVIVDQRGADARDLVRTDRGSEPLPQIAMPLWILPAATARPSGITNSG
jgi:hypothetical protein